MQTRKLQVFHFLQYIFKQIVKKEHLLFIKYIPISIRLSTIGLRPNTSA